MIIEISHIEVISFHFFFHAPYHQPTFTVIIMQIGKTPVYPCFFALYYICHPFFAPRYRLSENIHVSIDFSVITPAKTTFDRGEKRHKKNDTQKAISLMRERVMMSSKVSWWRSGFSRCFAKLIGVVVAVIGAWMDNLFFEGDRFLREFIRLIWRSECALRRQKLVLSLL